MFKILFVSIFLGFLSASSFAAEKLLDCNIPAGDTQQATVKSEGTQLSLLELDAHGRFRSRALSNSEWASKRIRLYAQSGAKAVLFESRDGWTFQYASPGFTHFGFADCD